MPVADDRGFTRTLLRSGEAVRGTLGTRISASLRAVQFKRDGDPFGEKPVDPTEVFEDESGEETL